MSITPYAEKAQDYINKGWEILPLPEKSKFAPPAGYTGADAREVSEDIALGEWMDIGANVGLKLPRGVVGIDIDAYKDGGKSYTTLTNELGSLPETVGVSSHGSLSEGGTLFFTVPKDIVLVSGVGTVDLIQHHHRYSVAPPSIHPSGRVYRWISSSGFELPWVPEPDELPDLPQAWVERLAMVETPADLFDDVPFVAGEGAPCKRMNSLLKGALIRLRERKIGRHDLMVRATWAFTQEAAKGHTGYERVLAVYRRAWEKSFTPQERAERPLSLEYSSAVRGAQRKTRSASGGCLCAPERLSRGGSVNKFKMWR